ncbi:MAG: ABC transporter substrate-binding protein, partial [bacterium]
MIYKIIPSLEEKLQQLRNGDLEVSAAKVSDLYQTPGIKVVETGLMNIVFLGFNCQADPFSKVEARRAVAQALDKK